MMEYMQSARAANPEFRVKLTITQITNTHFNWDYLF